MKSLTSMLKGIQRVALPVILAGAGLIGCATYSPTLPKLQEKKSEPKIDFVANQGIDLGNGYHVESLEVAHEIDLLTALQKGEIKAIVRKFEGNYKIEQLGQTSKYDTTPIEEWNNAYKEICDSVDNGDRLICESEIQRYLDKKFGLKWIYSDSDTE